MWLGGRDSNPDNLVQRSVLGLRSAPVCSVLFGFSRSNLRSAPVGSRLLLHKVSQSVSGRSYSMASRRYGAGRQDNRAAPAGRVGEGHDVSQPASGDDRSRLNSSVLPSGRLSRASRFMSSETYSEVIRFRVLQSSAPSSVKEATS